MLVTQPGRAKMLKNLQTIRIHYPNETRIDLIDDSIRQKLDLTVVSVRDLVRKPLTAAEFLADPFARQSRWMITAIDLFSDDQTPKNYYLGASDEYASPGCIRLALYEPGDTTPAVILCREINPTMADRMELIRTVTDWNEEDHPGFELRIVADDLRVVA